MDKKEFVAFCKREFYKRDFKKVKNGYYLDGDKDILGAIFFQKSDYSESYYINCSFSIKGYNKFLPYPSYHETDIDKRIVVPQKRKKEVSLWSTIYFDDFTENELRPWFDKAFDEWILPPIKEGKKFILNNLNTLYTLTLNADEILNELQR
jgi:hypothetical protein